MSSGMPRAPITVAPIPVAGEMSNHMQTDIRTLNATLMVTSPSSHGDIIVRPIQYDFGEKVINSIHNAMDANADLSRATLSGRDPVIASAILPSSNGIEMNASQIADLWSFTLMIDNPREGFRVPGSDSNAPTGQRSTYTGYVIGEPLSLATNVRNPDAIYISTHLNKISISESILNVGHAVTTHITTDDDIIPNMTQQYYKDDLMLLSPGDMYRASYIDEDTMTGGNINNAAVSTNTPSCSIGMTSLQSAPTFHMDGIVSSVHRTMSDINHSHSMESSILHHNIMSPQDSFRQGFSDQLYSAGIGNRVRPGVINGIDHTKPITMRELEAAYPHMVVIPIVRDSEVQEDVRSQAGASPQNVFSSMVSTTISAICGHLGISNVSFTYGSWIANLRSLGENGMWEMLSFGTIVPKAGQELEALLGTFKSQLNSALFQVLLHQNGDFWISVQYSSIGDIIIDLQFNDYNVISGLYVTSANLGGLSKAAMGNINSFDHNATYLSMLAGAMGGMSSEVPPMEDSYQSQIFQSSGQVAPVSPQIASAHVHPDYRVTQQAPIVSDHHIPHNNQQEAPPVTGRRSLLGGNVLRSPLLK